MTEKGKQLISSAAGCVRSSPCHVDHEFAQGGECFHVLNRAVTRLPRFEKEEDFDAFERVLTDAFEREALPMPETKIGVIGIKALPGMRNPRFVNIFMESIHDFQPIPKYTPIEELQGSI